MIVRRAVVIRRPSARNASMARAAVMLMTFVFLVRWSRPRSRYVFADAKCSYLGGSLDFAA
jgi:hypothetical protein